MLGTRISRHLKPTTWPTDSKTSVSCSCNEKRWVERQIALFNDKHTSPIVYGTFPTGKRGQVHRCAFASVNHVPKTTLLMVVGRKDYVILVWIGDWHAISIAR